MKKHSKAILAAVSSGVLYILCLNVGPVGIAVLIAPVPVLLYALSNASARSVLLVALASQLIGSIGFDYAFAAVFPVPAIAVVDLVLAVEFAVLILLTRACVRRLPPWAAVLSFPVLTTSIEFLLQMVSPHGTYGALGYSLIDQTLLIQVASLGGIAAVTFIAALVPMAIALLIARDNRHQVLIASLIPLLFTIAFGAWRLNQPYHGEARVALASIDSLVMHAARDPQVAPAIARTYADLIEGLSAANLDAVMLPERMFADAGGQTLGGSEPLQEAANALHTRVIAGFHETSADGVQRNTARVFAPQAPWKTYTKRRLIPGLESALQPGHGSLIMQDRGVAICKDLDFAPMMREYGEKNIRMLFVPAWDFVTDGRFHAHMAVMRGVENGFAIARAAAMGRLTVSDAYGRVVAEVVTSDKAPVTLVAAVGLTNTSTVYAHIGDVFGWLAVVCALGLLLWTFAISQQMPSARAMSATDASLQVL